MEHFNENTQAPPAVPDAEWIEPLQNLPRGRASALRKKRPPNIGSKSASVTVRRTMSIVTVQKLCLQK